MWFIFLQTDLEVERIVFSNRTDDSIVLMKGRAVKFNRTTIVINVDFETLIDFDNNVQVNWMCFIRNFNQKNVFLFQVWNRGFYKTRYLQHKN
jgi:hypothetical protein